MAGIPKKVSEFKVGNTLIQLGQKYVLDHKFDALAPEGLKKIEATKFPFTGSGVMDCINFDNQKNLYDTGFYAGSYALSQYSEADREVLVPYYDKYIKKPFEEYKNVDLRQDSKNDFWSDYRYEAYVNKEFDTNKPDEMFELFQVIIQGVACEKNEKNPFYRSNAQFTISNPQATKNKNKERTKTRLKAIQELTMLADADKDKLDLILQYVGKESSSKVKAEDVKYIYFEVINDGKSGLDFAERFIEANEEYEKEQGKLKMEYFKAISDLHKDRKINKDRRGFVTESGDYLGNTLQDIAKFCLNADSSQAKAIDHLLEKNPQFRRTV